MVVTRSQTNCCNANNGGPSNPHNHNHNHSTGAIVHRDAARVAVGHRTSARSRGKKSDRALQPQSPREDKHKRARRRETVPARDTTTQHGGRKATRGKEPRATQAQPTKKGRGSKPRVNVDRPKETDNTLSGQNHASSSGKRGTKRRRDDEEDTPGSEIPTKRVKHTRGNASPPSIPRSTGKNIGFPRQGVRRSARLAAKCPAPISRDTPDEGAARVIHSTTRDREHVESVVGDRVNERRVQECAQNPVIKAESNGGCFTGSGAKSESSEETLVADSRTANNIAPSEHEKSSSSPCPVKKEEEEVDPAWLNGIEIHRYPSAESVPAETYVDRGGSEFRSSSVDSFELKTPPPDADADTVRIRPNTAALASLDIIPIREDADEDDDEEFLPPPPLLNGRIADEVDEDDDEHGNDNNEERRRSLAPEPEDGLLAQIRLGRIPGLASPVRSTIEG